MQLYWFILFFSSICLSATQTSAWIPCGNLFMKYTFSFLDIKLVMVWAWKVAASALKNINLCENKVFFLQWSKHVEYVRMNRHRMMKLPANKHEAHLDPRFARRAEEILQSWESVWADQPAKGPPWSVSCTSAVHLIYTCSCHLFPLTTTLSDQSLWKKNKTLASYRR